MENIYRPILIEKYLKIDKIKDLPQEVKDEIVRVRTTYEYMSFEQFRELHLNLKLVKRTVKLKSPRSLWVCEEGRIWFFNFHNKRFEYCGFFHTDEFLEGRFKKEQQEREEREQIKAEKKRAKVALNKPTVKLKRKRI